MEAEEWFPYFLRRMAGRATVVNEGRSVQASLGPVLSNVEFAKVFSRIFLTE